MLQPKCQVSGYIHPQLAEKIPALLKALNQKSVSKLVAHLIQEASDSCAVITSGDKTSGDKRNG
jgi:hypothetical protein